MMILDTREPKGLRFQIASRCETEKIQTSEDALPEGDYWMVYPNGFLLLVERKTPGDLASSLVDGRLFKQAKRCIERVGDNGLAALLIEGAGAFAAPTPKGVRLGRPGVHPNAVRGALLSLQLDGVYVVHSSGPEDTATALTWLYRRGHEFSGRLSYRRTPSDNS